MLCISAGLATKPDVNYCVMNAVLEMTTRGKEQAFSFSNHIVTGVEKVKLVHSRPTKKVVEIKKTLRLHKVPQLKFNLPKLRYWRTPVDEDAKRRYFCINIFRTCFNNPKHTFCLKNRKMCRRFWIVWDVKLPQNQNTQKAQPKQAKAKKAAKVPDQVSQKRIEAVSKCLMHYSDCHDNPGLAVCRTQKDACAKLDIKWRTPKKGGNRKKARDEVSYLKKLLKKIKENRKPQGDRFKRENQRLRDHIRRLRRLLKRLYRGRKSPYNHNKRLRRQIVVLNLIILRLRKTPRFNGPRYRAQNRRLKNLLRRLGGLLRRARQRHNNLRKAHQRQRGLNGRLRRRIRALEALIRRLRKRIANLEKQNKKPKKPINTRAYHIKMAKHHYRRWRTLQWNWKRNKRRFKHFLAALRRLRNAIRRSKGGRPRALNRRYRKKRRLARIFFRRYKKNKGRAGVHYDKYAYHMRKLGKVPVPRFPTPPRTPNYRIRYLKKYHQRLAAFQDKRWKHFVRKARRNARAYNRGRKFFLRGRKAVERSRRPNPSTVRRLRATRRRLRRLKNYYRRNKARAKRHYRRYAHHRRKFGKAPERLPRLGRLARLPRPVKVPRPQPKNNKRKNYHKKKAAFHDKKWRHFVRRAKRKARQYKRKRNAFIRNRNKLEKKVRRTPGEINRVNGLRRPLRRLRRAYRRNKRRAKRHYRKYAYHRRKAGKVPVKFPKLRRLPSFPRGLRGPSNKALQDDYHKRMAAFHDKKWRKYHKKAKKNARRYKRNRRRYLKLRPIAERGGRGAKKVLRRLGSSEEVSRFSREDSEEIRVGLSTTTEGTPSTEESMERSQTDSHRSETLLVSQEVQESESRSESQPRSRLRSPPESQPENLPRNQLGNPPESRRITERLITRRRLLSMTRSGESMLERPRRTPSSTRRRERLT